MLIESSPGKDSNGENSRYREGCSTLHSPSWVVELEKKLAPPAFEDPMAGLPTQGHTLMRMPVCCVFVSMLSVVIEGCFTDWQASTKCTRIV
jgi:hypothetical protein